MKKILILLLSFSQFVNAQIDADWLNDSLARKKKVAELEILSVQVEGDSTKEYREMKYCYNENGQLRKVFANGVFQDSSVFVYDAAHRLQSYSYYEMGRFSSKTEYSYNEKGWKTLEVEFSNFFGKLKINYKEKYKYDIYGNELLCKHKEKGKSWKRKTTYEYLDGVLQNSVTRYSHHKDVLRLFYNYTDSSTVITSEKTVDGYLKERILEEYDEFGNLVLLRKSFAKNCEKLKLSSERLYRFVAYDLVFAEVKYFNEGEVRSVYNYNVKDGLVLGSPRDKWSKVFRYKLR